MITIWKKVSEESFELVEQFTGDIPALMARLVELRADGSEYRAEQRTECFSLIFDL
jgi:hypothetical protein